MALSPLRIGILSTRSRRYHPNRRLLEAAQALSQEACLLHPKAVQAQLGGQRMAPPNPGELPHVFLPRIGATIDASELAVVYHLEQLGIPAVNGFAALVVARDKFLSLRKLDSLGIPVPRSFLVAHWEQVPPAIDALGGFPVVIKATRGRQGTDVHLVKETAFARYLLQHPPRPLEGLLIQEYLPAAERGDVRVVVVGERAVASMRRIPRRGEFRANAHLRGKGRPWQPPEAWIALAVQVTAALELQVAGVDLMDGPNGPMVLEVNTTPGFRELERVTGIDVAGEIVRHAVQIAARRW